MMLDEHMKVMVCSPDPDMDFFDIGAGILQRDTLAPYIFISCLHYVLETVIDLTKKNSFTLKDKQMVSHEIYEGCRWSSTSCEYTCLSWIPTA